MLPAARQPPRGAVTCQWPPTPSQLLLSPFLRPAAPSGLSASPLAAPTPSPPATALPPAGARVARLLPRAEPEKRSEVGAPGLASLPASSQVSSSQPALGRRRALWSWGPAGGLEACRRRAALLPLLQRPLSASTHDAIRPVPALGLLLCSRSENRGALKCGVEGNSPHISTRGDEPQPGPGKGCHHTLPPHTPHTQTSIIGLNLTLLRPDGHAHNQAGLSIHQPGAPPAARLCEQRRLPV